MESSGNYSNDEPGENPGSTEQHSSTNPESTESVLPSEEGHMEDQTASTENNSSTPDDPVSSALNENTQESYSATNVTESKESDSTDNNEMNDSIGDLSEERQHNAANITENADSVNDQEETASVVKSNQDMEDESISTTKTTPGNFSSVVNSSKSEKPVFKTFYSSNIIDTFTFSFTSPVIDHTQATNSLKITEIQFEPSAQLDFEQESKNFEQFWKLKQDSYSFMIIALLFLKREYLPLLGFQLCEGTSKLLRTYFVYKLIESFITKGSYQYPEIWIWGALFFLANVVYIVCFGQSLSRAKRVSRRLNSILISILYRKYINSKDTSNEMSSKINDMISNGLQNTKDWIYYLVYIPMTLIELIVSVIFLKTCILHDWETIFWFFALFMVLIGLQLLVIWRLVVKTKQLEKERSVVTSIFSNSICGIQIIKYYCWNNVFTRFIIESSQRFFKVMMSHTVIFGMLFGIFVSATSFLRPLPFFFNHTPAPHQDVAFLCLIFGLVFTVTFQFMKCLMLLITRNSLMVRYCEIKDELKKKTGGLLLEHPEIDANSIEFVNANLVLDEFILNIENLNIRNGEMVAVIGAIGSGKTAFLLTILNHYPLISGELRRTAKVSFAPQTPWIITGTVRDNILLGREMNQAWYRKILSACCLDPDIDSWDEADLKFVGERGISLSGGQKARISLARALYTKDASIFVLDDVLSALDSRIQRQVFLNIKNLYEDKKTILLSINQMNYLSFFDSIILVEQNKIAFHGNYNDLVQLKTSKFVADNVLIDITDLSVPASPALPSTPSVYEIPTYSATQLSFEDEHLDESDTSDDDLVLIGNKQSSESSEVPIEKEITKKYSKKNATRIFWDLICTGECRMYVPLIIILGLTFYPIFVYQYDILKWVKRKKVWVLFFNVLFCIIPVVIATSKSLLMLFSIRKSARIVYGKSIESIMNASSDFFVKTSIGSLLSVLSKDLNVITNDFLTYFVEGGEYIFLIIFIYGYNTMTCPWVLMLFPFATFWIFLAFKKFKKCMDLTKKSELRQLDKLIDHFSSSREGLPVINCLGADKKFISDAYLKTYRHFVITDLEESLSAWLGIRVDAWSCCHIAIYIACTIVHQDKGSPVDIGYGIYGGFNLLSTVQMLISSYIILSNQLLSADRLLALTRIPPEEDESSLKAALPVPGIWPDQGKIVFQDVSCIYPGTKTKILDSVSFEILPREKVAVIGRTGAGKSSLISVLFRIMQPIYPGQVLIDSLDLQQIPISTLRHRIAIVPQDPYIFEQTIRNNIDPEGMYSEELIWKSVEKVSMRKKIERLPHRLDTVASDSVSFSDGEKQLISLARALIKEPKVIVFDEANAKLDPKTASKIMDICSKELKDCVVIFIVHRIDTILDFDKIMVLERGMLKEFAAPYELLQNESSYFSQMLRSSSNTEESYQEKYEIAKAHYFSKATH